MPIDTSVNSQHKFVSIPNDKTHSLFRGMGFSLFLVMGIHLFNINEYAIPVR